MISKHWSKNVDNYIITDNNILLDSVVIYVTTILTCNIKQDHHLHMVANLKGKSYVQYLIMQCAFANHTWPTY